MLVQIVLLIVGLSVLIKGADLFVENASKIAKKFHIPEIVIGLTIVAFGTSAPEAAISITGALAGNAEISVGNAIGSNIMNILLILGLSGMIGKLRVKNNTYRYEIPFVMIITLVLLFLGKSGSSIDRQDGFILWGLFLVFIYYLYTLVKVGEDTSLDEVEQLGANDTIIRLVGFGLIGMLSIIIGSDLTIDAAVIIAGELGLSQRFIGLTIISFGTSLPELITSITAVSKGKTDMSVGSIVGSNIFNILFVLGTTAIVSPVAIGFDQSFIVDGIVAIGALIIFYVFINKNKELRTIGAFIMFICYFLYFITII